MQYIQLQGQSAPEMDTPLAGSYNLFIDGSDGSVKIIDDQGNWYGDSSLISVTYEGLRILQDDSELRPGSHYLISDFKTCYDQPDYDLGGSSITTGNYKTDAETSPIIVFATATNKLAANAFQPEFPKDSIKYDITFNETEVTNSPARGRITERIDEWGNRTDYDHRAILFRRYDNYYYEETDKHPGTIQLIADTGEVIGVGTSFTDYSAGNYVAIPGVNQTFFQVVSVASDTSMIVTGRSIPALSAGASLYSAQRDGLTYKQNNISIEYTEHPTFIFDDETIVGNYFGDVASLREWNEYDFLLPNNVFGEDVIGNRIGNGFRNNTFDGDVEHNVIGDAFRNNTIYNEDEDFAHNQIGNDFSNNLIICDDFNNNVIGNDFNNNKIFNNDDFVDNQIGVGFSSNTIYNDFEHNKIGNGFETNIIDGTFSDNSIANQFNNNTILTEFIKNSIGYYFYDNTVANYFKSNTIGDDFEMNTIGYTEDPGNDNFQNNQFGDDHKGNLFLGYFSDNIIGNYSAGNEFNGSTTSNKLGNYISSNTIDNQFYGNIIGNGIHNNQIGENFTNNQIGNSFEDNTIANYFAYNVIGHQFQDNNIENDFGFGGEEARGNRIGNNFRLNTVGEYFYDNNIGDNFEGNTMGNYFQFNRIEATVLNTNFTEYLGTLVNFSYPSTAGTDGVYTGLTGATSGSGVNSIFTVAVTSGLVSDVEVSTIGTLYQIDDTITIASSSFGGTSNLVLTVTQIGPTPVVYTTANSNIIRNYNGDLKLTYIGTSFGIVGITEPFD